MGLEQYEANANKSQTTFDFISEGPKGQIVKRVRFTKIKGYKNLYNLGFGDVNKKSSKIDYRVVTDNQDREKVLATVTQALIHFTNRYPKRHVFFQGSNKARTRLYQMAIAKYFEDLTESFKILGLTDDGWVTFEKNTTYIAFLINRK